MPVSRRLRFEILRRDRHTCRYCGATAPDVKLTVDHVVPQALGGSDEPSNLVTACDGCNGGKSSVPPDAGVVANVAADALRWSAAMQRAADEMIEDIDRRNLARAEFDEAWIAWGIGHEAARQPVPRPNDWALSVDQFIAAGLPMAVLVDCIDKAMRNGKVQPEATFRYMCGIAWKKIQQLQETARESLVDVSAKSDSPLREDRMMYWQLSSHIFGQLTGVSSQEDAAVMASAHRASAEDDEDDYEFDEQGHAACEVVNQTAELLVDYREAARILLRPLPEETFSGFAARAADELNWNQRLTVVDDGRLYREALGARMLLLCAQQLINDSEEDSE